MFRAPPHRLSSLRACDQSKLPKTERTVRLYLFYDIIARLLRASLGVVLHMIALMRGMGLCNISTQLAQINLGLEETASPASRDKVPCLNTRFLSRRRWRAWNN
jgi:hypothetical protein